MKKLITLALASTTALMLAGCGATDTVAIDTSKMTDGTSNKTGLGGYWWTYVDRSTASSITPNTGKVNPTDPVGAELNPGIAAGNGIEADETGNLAMHVTGTVAAAPTWSGTLGTTTCTVTGSTIDWCDPYVNTNYGSFCKDGKCGEVKYPAAGLGFGFKASNEVIGADATGKVGIAFRMKIGAGQGQTKTVGVYNDVAISLPLDLTDVPDKSFGDKYGTQFADGPMASGIPKPDVTAPNAPFCSFPQSFTAAGLTDGTSVVGGTNKTCFANLATLVKPIPTTTWTNYCVRWEAFQAPGWAAGLPLVGLGALKDATATPPVDFSARIIKMQFDAYKPLATETAATFDFWVDDVYLLDDTNWAAHCTGAQEIVKSAETKAP